MNKVLPFLTLVFFLFCGCDKKKQRSNETRLTTGLREFNGAAESDKLMLLKQLDSLYAVNDNISLYTKLDYFFTKGEYLYQSRTDRKSATSYIDQVIAACKRHAATDSKMAVLGYKALISKARMHIQGFKNYDSGFAYIADAQVFKNQHFTDTCNLEYSNIIGDVLYAQARYQDAIRYYFINVARSLNCQPLTFERFALAQNSLNSIGLSFLNLGLNDSAAVYLDSAYSFINNSRVLFPEKEFLNLAAGVVLNTQAHLASNLSQFNEAEKLYLKSIHLVEKDYPEFSIDTRLALSNIYLRRQQWREMAGIIDSLQVKLANMPPKTRLLADFYHAKFRYYEGINLLDSALYYQKEHVFTKEQLKLENKTFFEQDVQSRVVYRQSVLERNLLARDAAMKNSQLTIANLLSVMAVITLAFFFFHYRKSVKHAVRLRLLADEISLSHKNLLHSFAALEQSHTSNKRLLSTVAHDLRSPIRGIRQMCRTMFKDRKAENFKENVEIIKTTCKDLLSTVGHLLSNKNQGTAIREETIDLELLIQNCAKLMQSKADDKKQKIISHTTPVTLNANRERIFRVVSHLLHNAVKFSGPNTTIHINLTTEEEIALISIADEGIGIPDDKASRLFSFEDRQNSRTDTEDKQTYGLSLALSKAIIEQHNGSIWFKPNQPRGNIFFVSLPLARESAH